MNIPFAVALDNKDVALIVASLVIVALLVICTIALVKLMFRVDQALERRQKSWQELSTTMAKAGFRHISSILAALSRKDWAGAAGEAEHLGKEMRDPVMAATILSEAFFVQLADRFKDETDRTKIMKIVDEWRIAHPPMVPATATPKPVA